MILHPKMQGNRGDNMKKSGSGKGNTAHIFMAVQFLILIVLLAVLIFVDSEFIRSAMIVLCIVFTLVVMFLGLEKRKSVISAEASTRVREKIYDDEMASVLYGLPEGSSVVKVDLSAGKVLSYHIFNERIREKISSGNEDDLIEICTDAVLSEIRNEKQKKQISDMLDTEKLLERYKANEKELTYTYNVILDDESIEIRKISVHMLENPVSGAVEAVIQIIDVSDEYYENIVGSYLAMRQFKFTTLIFINSGRGRSLANNSEMGKENKFYDYDFFRKDIYDKLIDLNERDEFYEKMAADAIRENLEKDTSYSVFVHGISEIGEKRFLKYEFQYIDAERETVLLCVADETSVWEKDILTDLCNYKGFISQAEYALQKSSEDDEYTVIVTNIKWFKVINKIFGSARCDQFLKDFSSQLIRSDLRPVVVGRFPSSDHFILLVNRKNFDFNELIKLSKQRIETKDREVDILVISGIYNVSDKNGSVTDMVEHAIMASKGIKDMNNIPYAVFSEMEEERYLSGKLAVSEFEKALRNGEFLPFYQPIFDAVTHKPVSAEALVRWKKNGSFVPPGMFIPALEENGNVSRVDQYISESVTNHLSRRKAAGKHVVPVSINLSVMDFYSTETINGVMKNIDTMLENDIVPRYEITETAWADASDNRNDVIEKMRNKGTQILIDDFGSGYSSFSTIRDFSFDILKIDMGFIRKIGTSQKADGIITSIIDMAHFIGMKVVAEGVETQEHLDFLTSHGCDYIQGYYFSKPLPEEEFEKLLDEQ